MSEDGWRWSGIGLACLVVAGAGWWWQWQSHARVLSAGVTVVEAMQVANRDGQTAVIVPAASLWRDQEQAYVLVATDEGVARLDVDAQAWRSGYWLVCGVPDQAVVILTPTVQLGQNVSYNLINPEAGDSGSINR